MGRRLLAIKAIAGRSGGPLAAELRNVVHFSRNDRRLIGAAVRAVFIVPIQHPPGQGLGEILLVTGLTSSLHHGQVLDFGARRRTWHFLGSNRLRLAAV